MNTQQILVYGVSMVAAIMGSGAIAQQENGQYVQVAEIEVYPAQLDAYRAAVQEQIDAAIRKEPRVLMLYAVSDKNNPTHVRVFEIYRDRRNSPRSGSFQEIQGDRRDDGEVAQAGAGDANHARSKIKMRSFR